MYATDMDGAWRLYCPETLLPTNGIPRGTITRDGEVGALVAIKVASGDDRAEICERPPVYVQVNAGVVRMLDQRAVRRALEEELHARLDRDGGPGRLFAKDD